MADLEARVDAQVDLLAQHYARHLPQKLVRIDETWAALQRTWGRDTRDLLQRLIHNLAGSGASFGFTALSDRAREAELLLKVTSAGGQPLTIDHVAQITTLLESMKLAIEFPDRAALEESTTPSSAQDHPPTGKTIFLYEDDTWIAGDLARQLGYFGYQVFAFDNLDDLRSAATENRPAAVLLDMALPEGRTIANPLQDAGANELLAPPIIFISARSDLSARMPAVRAGGVAYFTKPIDIGSLIDKLDKLTIHQASEPYRVLIVDDEMSLAKLHERTLRKAGMTVSVVTDPMQLMGPLVDLKPDLILMDMYMPGITGTELASVIRQQEAYVSVPIVFLSAETDMSKQLRAMQLGGDDFLTKPIKADHLISAVTSRVERLRILRSFMVRDSLTGLLNHTFMKQQLEVEVARARRSGRPLSFALIDIDHFKSVNDSYGHPAGDRVIKSISRLLKQRLRETDLIGRYGGEEFAVILPDTSIDDAVHVLDELRTGFSQIRHIAEGAEFYVTFSGGVATLPPAEDAVDLNDTADKALYSAKQAGRNRIWQAAV